MIGQLTFMDLFHIFFGSALGMGGIVAFFAQRRVWLMRRARAAAASADKADAQAQATALSVNDEMLAILNTVSKTASATALTHLQKGRYRPSSRQSHRKVSLKPTSARARHVAIRDEHGGLAAS
ncbi:hypothetical protein [Chromobacterium amazonense]|uniref:hypothetical protein n=1 Tax=Chromobacterium amazonense TaxID=1382803 RepID=UPI0031F696F6